MIGLLTAGKLVAALLFAGLAWYTSQLIKPLFPEGSDPGWFEWTNLVVGFAVGWVVAGSRAGTGWMASISYGLTTAVALVFWGLLLNCGAEMINLSLRKQYDGPMDAVMGVFKLMIHNFQLMMTTQVVGTLLIGSMIAGLITEIAGRNFR